MNSQTMRVRGLALAILSLVLAVGTGTAQERLAIVAKRIITGGQIDLPGGVMLIENGRIKAIGSDLRIPEGYRVIDRKDAVIAPGIIDLASLAGAPNDLSESDVAVERIACAADAVDLEHRDFGLLARHGVTTAVVLPGDRSVVAGQGCAIKTGDRVRWLDRLGVLRLNLSTTVLSRTRFPASYADAKAMLEAVMNKAEAGKEVKHFNDFAAGKLAGLVRVRDAYQIRDALEMKKRFGLSVALMGAEDLQRALPDLDGKGVMVALSAPKWQDNRRIRGLAARAEAAGMRVAFFAETPKRHPDALRQGAIAAARGGLSRRAAIASITGDAAEIAGLGDRVGRLGVGYDADFLVLSGDLLDARSRLHETWIDGRRVYRAAPKGAQK